MVPVLLLFVSLLAFGLVRLAPGGPFDRERKPASPEIDAALKARYHLDEPLWRQYGRFLGGLAHGDFGASLRYRSHTVTDVIAQGLPVSLTLGSLAFLFAVGVGVPAGCYLARHPSGAADIVGSLLSMLAVSLPGFLIGPILILVFAIELRWFPVALWESPRHMILPAVALGLYFAGKIARLLREGLRQTLSGSYIQAARARGLSEPMIFLRHALPLALVPVISVAGPMLADLLTGSFVIEAIFQIPGLGGFLVNSCLSRDYPMIVGLVLVYAVLLISLNLVFDFIHAWIDPRIKHD
jgi:oligopeptide transport system permease protein